MEQERPAHRAHRHPADRGGPAPGRGARAASRPGGRSHWSSRAPCSARARPAGSPATATSRRDRRSPRVGLRHLRGAEDRRHPGRAARLVDLEHQHSEGRDGGAGGRARPARHRAGRRRARRRRAVRPRPRPAHSRRVLARPAAGGRPFLRARDGGDQHPRLRARDARASASGTRAGAWRPSPIRDDARGIPWRSHP